jgi:peptide deformylase
MAVKPLRQLAEREFLNKAVSLRQSTVEVSDFGQSLQELVDDLVDTMNHHPIAIGLAAPQIGSCLRVAVINISSEKKDPPLILVNPRIESLSGKKDIKKESCMSLPHFQGAVERRHNITITYQDRFGAAQTRSATGFLSRVICHEIDHLDGLLYVDRMRDPAKIEPVEFFRSYAASGS